MTTLEKLNLISTMIQQLYDHNFIINSNYAHIRTHVESIFSTTLELRETFLRHRNLHEFVDCNLFHDIGNSYQLKENLALGKMEIPVIEKNILLEREAILKLAGGGGFNTNIALKALSFRSTTMHGMELGFLGSTLPENRLFSYSSFTIPILDRDLLFPPGFTGLPCGPLTISRSSILNLLCNREMVEVPIQTTGRSFLCLHRHFLFHSCGNQAFRDELFMQLEEWTVTFPSLLNVIHGISDFYHQEETLITNRVSDPDDVVMGWPNLHHQEPNSNSLIFFNQRSNGEHFHDSDFFNRRNELQEIQNLYRENSLPGLDFIQLEKRLAVKFSLHINPERDTNHLINLMISSFVHLDVLQSHIYYGKSLEFILNHLDYNKFLA